MHPTPFKGEIGTEVVGQATLAIYVPACGQAEISTRFEALLSAYGFNPVERSYATLRLDTINAWDSEDFVKVIKATGCKQIIIAGVVTDMCMAFPTLSALEGGFDVFVVTDASATFDTTVQQAAWSRMTQASAQMMNWFSVACELHRDSRNDIEGQGNLVSQQIPSYHKMNSYSAVTAHQS